MNRYILVELDCDGDSILDGIVKLGKVKVEEIFKQKISVIFLSKTEYADALVNMDPHMRFVNNILYGLDIEHFQVDAITSLRWGREI